MNNNTIEKSVKSSIPFILIVAVIAFLISVIGIVYIVNRPVTIDMNKYITYEVEGYDGYGEASISIDWDAITARYGNKLKFTREAKKEYGDILNYTNPMSILSNSVYVGLETNKNLFNGDTVNYKWISDQSSIDAIKCKLNYEDGSFKVKGLEETTKINLFKDIKESLVTFSGRDGEAKAKFSEVFNETKELYRDDTIIVLLNGDEYYPYISVISDNKEIAALTPKIDNTYGLSNGDVVTFSLTGGDRLVNYGYAVADSTKEYTVSDRSVLYSSKNDIDTKLVEEYVLSFVNSTYPRNNESYTKDNIVINTIYAATAKDTYVTNNKFGIVVVLSYDLHYKSKYYSSDDRCEYILKILSPYTDNGKLCFDEEREWETDRFNTAEYYIGEIENNYILEQIK